MSRGHVAVRAVSPRALLNRRANQEEVSISRASDEKEKESWRRGRAQALVGLRIKESETGDYAAYHEAQHG